MGIRCRVSVVAIALVISAVALADPNAVPASAMYEVDNDAAVSRRTEPRVFERGECWVEHVQVQPARSSSRMMQGATAATDATGGTRDKHLGAEHWNADAQRACRLEWLTDAVRVKYGR